METPQTQVLINNQGAQIIVPVGPGVFVTVVLGEETMNGVTAEWIKNRRALQTIGEDISNMKARRMLQPS